MDRLTFGYPPGAVSTERVAGTWLTKEAGEHLGQYPNLSNVQLLAAFGGLPYTDSVWPPGAVNAARQVLVWEYVFTVLALPTVIFALTEGLLPAKGAARSSKRRAETHA